MVRDPVGPDGAPVGGVTPDDFTFDWKLHRVLSRHSAKVDSLVKAIRDDVDTTPRGRVRLDDQLDELAALVEALAPHPVAIEVRHRAWVTPGNRESTLDWMEEHGAAFVAVDAPQGKPATLLPPLDAVTHPELAYLRVHGRNLEGWVHGRSVAERFGYRYDKRELRQIIGCAEALAEQAGSVRLMFNNNRGSDAPDAATRARELLGQGVPA